MQSALQPNFIDSLNINRDRSGPSAPPKSPFIPYRALCTGYSCFYRIDDTPAQLGSVERDVMIFHDACLFKTQPQCPARERRSPTACTKNKEKFQLSLLEKGEEKWSFSELESLKQESNPPNKKPPK